MGFSKKTWISTHGGKMTGIDSISTDVFLNPRCKARSKDKTCVCSQCYAQATVKQYAHCLEPHLIDNLCLYIGRILKADELPMFTTELFRFEAFGDLVNSIHCQNYFNACRLEVNAGNKVGLFTKNMDILRDVLINKEIEKPSNLSITVSSEKLNKPVDIPSDLLPFIDHRFTVYTLEYCLEHGVDINCGSKQCLRCGVCYERKENNDTFDIRELLKKDQKKIK